MNVFNYCLWYTFRKHEFTCSLQLFFIETGHYCFLINEKTKKDFYSLYAHILGPLISDNVYKFLLYGSFVKQLFTKF